MADTFTSKILSNKYELRDKLGAGGMGTVFRAFDRAMQREVAIKLFKQSPLRSSKQAARMASEAQVLGALSHPNIVKILASQFDDADAGFIVMELVEGETVAELVERDGAMSAARVTKLAAQAADALAHAHRNGVVHRDLKPQNLMVTRYQNGDELLKVMDFGIAKIVGVEDQRLTQTGEVIGTPQYISPEQCSNTEISPRTDIYSLGCTMYYMLTAHPPFEGDSPLEVLMKHADQPPDTGAIHDQKLRNIVAKCMEKDPALRFQAAEELQNTLLTGSLIERDKKRKLRLTPKQMIPYAVALAGLFVIGLVVFAFWWKWARETSVQPTLDTRQSEAIHTLQRLHFKMESNPKAITLADLRQLESLERVLPPFNAQVQNLYNHELKNEYHALGFPEKSFKHLRIELDYLFDHQLYDRTSLVDFCRRAIVLHHIDDAIDVVTREIKRQKQLASTNSDEDRALEARMLEYQLTDLLALDPNRKPQLDSLRAQLANDPQANKAMLQKLQVEQQFRSKGPRQVATVTAVYYMNLLGYENFKVISEKSPSNWLRACSVFALGHAYDNPEIAVKTVNDAIALTQYALDPKRKCSPYERKECRAALAEAEWCLREIDQIKKVAGVR